MSISANHWQNKYRFVAVINNDVEQYGVLHILAALAANCLQSTETILIINNSTQPIELLALVM